MDIKRAVCASTLFAGVGAAGLFGMSIGTAGADPGPPCGAPNAPQCDNNRHDNGGHNNGPVNNGGHDNGPAPVDWQHRDVNQGRSDHQPFMWDGHRVEPLRAGNGDGWGFWFLGKWIRL